MPPPIMLDSPKIGRDGYDVRNYTRENPFH